MGAPDGSAGSSQRGASTVVSSRELGAGLHWRVRHWCRRHHGARSRALRARAVWICAGRGGGATVGVLGRVGAAQPIADIEMGRGVPWPEACDHTQPFRNEGAIMH